VRRLPCGAPAVSSRPSREGCRMTRASGEGQPCEGCLVAHASGSSTPPNAAVSQRRELQPSERARSSAPARAARLPTAPGDPQVRTSVVRRCRASRTAARSATGWRAAGLVGPPPYQRELRPQVAPHEPEAIDRVRSRRAKVNSVRRQI